MIVNAGRPIRNPVEAKGPMFGSSRKLKLPFSTNPLRGSSRKLAPSRISKHGNSKRHRSGTKPTPCLSMPTQRQKQVEFYILCFSEADFAEALAEALRKLRGSQPCQIKEGSFGPPSRKQAFHKLGVCFHTAGFLLARCLGEGWGMPQAPTRKPRQAAKPRKVECPGFRPEGMP